jgi:hypothetical protein
MNAVTKTCNILAGVLRQETSLPACMRQAQSCTRSQISGGLVKVCLKKKKKFLPASFIDCYLSCFIANMPGLSLNKKFFDFKFSCSVQDSFTFKEIFLLFISLSKFLLCCALALQKNNSMLNCINTKQSFLKSFQTDVLSHTLGGGRRDNDRAAAMSTNVPMAR